jgi:23S rRNA (adenine2030-N6)-methyltransferase
VEVLNYLKQKDKPFVYIDTHAGAGLYALNSAMAEKNAEYLNGIGKLWDNTWPELKDYLTTVKQVVQKAPEANLYPGSPAIAQVLLRDQDRALCFDLHSSDFALLAQNMDKDRRFHIRKEDGFQALLKSLPPAEKRALVLMDPSYEIKSDYDTVLSVLIQAYKKFPSATYALWYPVVERARIDKLEQGFKDSGIKDVQLFELGLCADTQARGMTSAGMILINPPWVLKPKMDALLPKLSALLSEQGVWRSEILVQE